MPKESQGLTAAGVSKAKPGRHGDGRGLFLFVKPDGRRTWTFRFQIDGRAREMGLGVASGTGAISLAQARDKAGELHQLVKQGIDPLDKRAADEADAKAAAQIAEAKRKSFREVAVLYIAAHEAAWRNAKHAAQWTATL